MDKREAIQDAKRRLLRRSVPCETSDCILWVGASSKNGYGRINGLDQRMTGAHQLAYQVWCGEIPVGLDVCHKCDVRNCINPEHLWLGTRKENLQDMVAKGRHARTHKINQRGESNNAARLTQEQVNHIRRLRDSGLRQFEIMRETGVSRAQVWLIVHDKTWVS